MMNILSPQDLLNFVVPFFTVTSMAGAGMASSFREVTKPLKRPVLLIAVLVSNFVLAPLLAYGVVQLLSLGAAHSIGLFLLASAGGAPFLLALARGAGADVALATGILVVLIVTTIIYLPLSLPLAMPWATVRAWPIAEPLLLMMLLPLLAGLAWRAVAPKEAATLGELLSKAAQLSLIILVALMMLENLPATIAMVGSGALAAGFLFTLATFLSGYALGGPDPMDRAVLGLATGQRNVAAAIIVAAEVFAVETLVMVVATALVGFTVLFPAAFLLRRSEPRRPPKAGPSSQQPAL